MSIRLLYITHEPFPTYHADLAVLFGKYLPRLGLLADIVTEALPASDTSKSPTHWSGGDALVFTMPSSRGLQHIVKFIHNVMTMIGCDAEKYDAIQVRDLPVAALFGVIIARYKKLPFYYWMSYPQSEGQIHRAKARGVRAGVRYFFPLLQGYLGTFLLYKVVMPRAAHNFVQSEKMREDLVQLGLSFAKMTPVPMAVDLETTRVEDIVPIEDDRLTGKRVVLYMGTLDRTRQIEVLFEMLAIARQKLSNIILVIVGSTGDRGHLEWLKQEADRIGVSDFVLWTGWLPMSEAWRYTRVAEVGLSPIPRGFLLDMGIPTKALEYMALNVPVLCNDNPYQKRAVEESGAGLCVSLTAENFAAALLELLQNTEQRERMKTLGRQYITQFWNYEKVAADLFAVYQRLLNKASV